MRPPPRGPIAWIRRRPLPWAARWSAALGLLLLALLALVQTVTDRWLWSQYAYWLPAWAWVLAAWTCLAASCLLGWPSLRPGGVRLRPLLTLAGLAALLWLLFVRDHLHRALLAPGRDGSLRLVQWNLAGQDVPLDVGAAVVALDPDLVVLANLRFDGQLAQAETALRHHVGTDQPDGGSVLRLQGFLIASRTPITASGLAMLAPAESGAAPLLNNRDPGRIAFATLPDPTDPARSLTLWAVDLPSDLSLHRPRVMRAARLAIDRWRSPAHRMQPPGEGAAEFPAPDLVAGDFNTPRGSGSLSILVGPMREAHAAAGFGPGNTWRTPADWSRRKVPAWLSLATRWTGRWPIDLVFASDRYRVTRIQHTPKPDALHTLQVVDLEPGRP